MFCSCMATVVGCGGTKKYRPPIKSIAAKSCRVWPLSCLHGRNACSDLRSNIEYHGLSDMSWKPPISIPQT